MGVFSSECSHCHSKEHATGECPHGLFSSKCGHCGSSDHATSDCPQGFFSSKCGHCSSTEHATGDCPHGFFSSKCAHCGSTNHATSECPHGVFSSKCGKCGSKNHSASDCPHGFFSSVRESATDSAIGSGYVGLVLGLAFLVLALFVAISVFLTIPIWMGAAAVAGIVAYFHAPTVAERIKTGSIPAPSAIQRKRGRAPYYRLDRESLKAVLPFFSVRWIPVLSAVGFAAVMAIVMGGANQRDQVSTAIFVAACGLALIVSWRWSKRIYHWRLNELLVEHRKIDAGKAGRIARIWNVLSIGFVGLLMIGIIGSSVAYLAGPRISRHFPQPESPQPNFSNKEQNNHVSTVRSFPRPRPIPSFTSPAFAQRSAEIPSPSATAPIEPPSSSTMAEDVAPSGANSTTLPDVPVPQTNQSSPSSDPQVAESSSSSVPSAFIQQPTASPSLAATSFNEPENAAASGGDESSFLGERFSQTRTQVLTSSEINGWSLADVQYAINEIFARRGAVFPNSSLNTSFERFSWYHPRAGETLDQIEASLPPIEHQNVQTLGAAREAKKVSRPTFGAGAWYGLVFWKDGSIHKEEVIFDDRFTIVNERMSNTDQVSSWVSYHIQRGGNNFRWQRVANGHLATHVVTASRDGQSAQIDCQIIEGGRVAYMGSGILTRNDVPVPYNPNRSGTGN